MFLTLGLGSDFFLISASILVLMGSHADFFFFFCLLSISIYFSSSPCWSTILISLLQLSSVTSPPLVCYCRCSFSTITQISFLRVCFFIGILLSLLWLSSTVVCYCGGGAMRQCGHGWCDFTYLGAAFNGLVISFLIIVWVYLILFILF